MKSVWVEMACDAVASTPTCMLWLDITDVGRVFWQRASRLTPTRSSSFSPLEYRIKLKTLALRKKEREDFFQETLTSIRWMHHQRLISLMLQMYSILLWANVAVVDLPIRIQLADGFEKTKATFLFYLQLTLEKYTIELKPIVLQWRIFYLGWQQKIQREENQTDTSEYVFKSPFQTVQILGNQLLWGGLLWYILSRHANAVQIERTSEKVRPITETDWERHGRTD